MKRTEPSANAKLTPPGCRLEGPSTMAQYRSTGSERDRCEFGQNHRVNRVSLECPEVHQCTVEASRSPRPTSTVWAFSANRSVWLVPSVMQANRMGETWMYGTGKCSRNR